MKAQTTTFFSRFFTSKTLGIICFLLSCFIISSPQEVQATHVSGANFEYECIGGDTYIVRLNIFRDCSGAGMPNNINVTMQSPCGSGLVLQPWNRDSIVEVSQLCPSALANSTCQPAGQLPGMQQGFFSAIYYLPPCQAGPWQMSWGICCRNTTGNLTGQPQLSINAELNNWDAPCNNSPTFDAQPIPYVCANQPVNYNWGVSERDGDSIAFVFGMPYANNINTPVNFTAPYNQTNLFPVPVTLDPQTGQVTFTPNNAMVNQFWVIKVCAEEYRNGVQIGLICRDVQFVVQNCNNIQPSMVQPGIQNFTGTGSQTGPLSITACIGESFSFDIEFQDSLTASQASQTVNITSNATNVVPWINTAIVPGTYNAVQSTPGVITFSGTVPANSNPFYVFSIGASDGACPIEGITSEQFNLTVLPATYVPDDTLCGFADTLQVQPAGGDTFSFRVLQGDSMIPGVTVEDTTGKTGASLWFKPRFTTTYEVVSNLDAACFNIDTFEIVVKEINVGPDTMLCRGDTMTLGATGMIPCANGTSQYFWSPTTGLDNPNSLNPTLTVGAQQNTTMYTMVFDDGCGCQTADSFLVEVSDVRVDDLSWNKPTCDDSTGVIDITPAGGYPPYEFSLDTLTNYQVPGQFTGLPIGYYEGWVKDSLGCISIGVKDTIIDPNVPILDSTIIDDVTCFGAQNGQIEIFATFFNTYLNYSIDSGMTFQNNSTFPNLDPGTFTIVLKDDQNCTTLPEDVVVNTNGELFLDSVISRNLDCFEDNSGRIQVYGRGGTNPLEYTIDNGNTWVLNPDFDSVGADNYVIIVRDSFGCTTTPEAITITQPDELLSNLTIRNDSCFDACGGKATASVSGGTPPYTFNWNGYGANSNESWNLCADPSYMFDVTDDNGCVSERPFNITQPAKLEIDSIISKDLSCNGNKDGQITIYPTGGKRPYSYSIDGGSNFNPGNNFTGLEAGRYNIIVRDSAHRCEVIDEVLLIEPDPITLETPFSERTICVSNCINISASASGGTGNTYDFIWTGISSTGSVQSVCPHNDTTYAVYAEDVNGCVSNVEIFEIKLHDSLRVSTEKETEICPGDTVFLSAIGEGGNGQGYRYEWSPLMGLSSGIGQSINAYPSQTTTYTVRLSDACGSPTVTDTIRVNVRELPEVDFTVTDSVEGCEPFSTTLINLTEPIQFARWDIGDFSTTGFSIGLMDLSPGEYDVTLYVTTPEGCEGQGTKRNYLKVYNTPEANFYMDPNPTTIFNTNIQFRNQSSTDVVDWEWDFAGQDSSFESNPRYMMASDTGKFPIHLRVENRFGCWDEITKELIIGSEYNMFVPNAFTPNGDGLNDVFAPVALGVNDEDYSLQIFNRWGQIIFESNSLSRPWDGRIQSTGELAPGGVYIWKIIANDNTVEQTLHENMGSVTLIR